MRALALLSLVKWEASSAVFSLLGKPLIQMWKRNGPKIESWGSRARTGFHNDVYPFKTTPWNLAEWVFPRRS